ncbi:hypothetical protein CYCD_25100 [Tenuifilaceae bacterium CYCD]|nr:hypothetical protein CYCD_25100 [Tenuifilaceae bacterium CYCD]
MGNKFKLTILIMLGALSNAFSQSSSIASIKAKIDKDTILIGDQIFYTITVNGQKGVKFQFPAVTDSLGNGIDLVGKPSIDSVITDRDVTITLRYLVTAFDSGEHAMPVLPIVASLNGNADSLFATSSSLFVKTLPKDPNQKDIFDIKPPIREPIVFSEVAPWAGSGLVLVALIVLLIMYLKKRKQNKPFLNLFKPADPPHVVALRELQQIRDDKLWTSDNQKYYYTKLVDILRIYLEGRFGINAPEQTTSEILSEVNKINYSFNGLKDQLQDLLFTADLVKFAKHIPQIYENEQSLNFAFDFVDKTKPEEEVKTESSANDAEQNIVQETIDEQKKLN